MFYMYASFSLNYNACFELLKLVVTLVPFGYQTFDMRFAGAYTLCDIALKLVHPSELFRALHFARCSSFLSALVILRSGRTDQTQVLIKKIV